MSECFPTIVWDIADRSEWSTRLVGRHGAWQAPGPRGCCSSLLAPGGGLETIAEPHHRLWLETGWAARLPYITPASCGGGTFRWPGPAASGVRPTRTVIGFWGWDGREAQPALGPLAVTETGALWSPALRLLFSQHPEYLTPPLTPTLSLTLTLALTLTLTLIPTPALALALYLLWLHSSPRYHAPPPCDSPLANQLLQADAAGSGLGPLVARAVSVQQAYSASYWHLLMEVAPRLLFALPLLRADPGCHLVMP